jgi:hypothetical protein
MKWFLLFVFISIILLVLLFSFGRDLGSSGASAAPTAQPTGAPTWTPTSSGSPPTGNVGSPNIYYYLNMAIEDMERSTKFTQLEHINGASYQVVYAGFQQVNGVSAIFQINTRCECAGNAQCCSSLHTFVITMEAMDDVNYESLILGEVPQSVSDLKVVTFDHTAQKDGMTVPWLQVVSFLQGNLDGFRLWSEVTPVPN